MKLKFIRISLLSMFVAFVPHVGTAKALESLYTNLTDQCRDVETQEEGAYSKAVCPAPPGWQVDRVIFDDRSHLVLTYRGITHSLEKAMITDFKFGGFPQVGKLAEWRMGRNGPEALIVRMYYTKDSREESVLYVFDLRGDEPRLVRVTKSNEEARRFADQN